MNTLEIIIENGLAIRQIPKITQSRWFVKEDYKMKEGETEEQWKPDMEYFIKVSAPFKSDPNKRMEQFYSRFPNGRRLVTNTRIPNYAGYWMCREFKETGTTMIWSYKDHNLAPTLPESIELYLKNK